MKKRSLKVFLFILMLIILQLNTMITTSYAYAVRNPIVTEPSIVDEITPVETQSITEPDVYPIITSANLDPSMVTVIEDKSCIAPLGRFRMIYTIDNYQEVDITKLQITEVLIAKNKIIKESIVSIPNTDMYINGETNNGDVDNSPYTLRYSVKYNGEELLYGEETINVINTKINVSYSVDSPDTVFKGTNVTYKASIQSKSSVSLHNVVVSDSKLGELGRIDKLETSGSNSKKVIKKIMQLNKTTDSHLIVTFDDPLGKQGTITQDYVNTSIKIKVDDKIATPSINISASSGDPNSQGETEFAITIDNTGNTSLVDVEILDWNNNIIYTKGKITPEDKEITIFHDAKVESGKSYNLKVRAKVEGNTITIQDECTVETKNVEPKIEIIRTITPEAIKPGEVFTIHYVIKNIGSVPFKDIEITEPVLGKIESYTTLDIDAEIGFTKEFNTSIDSFSKTKFAAINSITNEEYIYEAPEVKIALETPDTFPELTILLSTEDETLEGTDTVEFSCFIKNTGTETLDNIEVFLTEGGKVLNSISKLAPGEEQLVILPTNHISKTETFQAIITAMGEDGEDLEFRSNELLVRVKTENGSDRILKVIFTVIILLIIAIAGTLFYLIKGTFKLPFKRKSKMK